MTVVLLNLSDGTEPKTQSDGGGTKYIAITYKYNYVIALHKQCVPT